MDIVDVDVAYGSVAQTIGLGVGGVPSSVVADLATEAAVSLRLPLLSRALTV